MALILFSEMRNPITAQQFASWPMAMQREFALLVTECGHPDAEIAALIGLGQEDLARARRTTEMNSLARVKGEELDEEAERQKAREKAYRNSDRAREFRARRKALRLKRLEASDA